jgi:hypothetical protein
MTCLVVCIDAWEVYSNFFVAEEEQNLRNVCVCVRGCVLLLLFLGRDFDYF